jgi:hypothetical protein
VRLGHFRRTFLTAVLLATAIGGVLAEDRVLDLTIHVAESLKNPPVLSVLQNDRIVIRLTSDKPLHVHLHGYDIERDIAPNVATSLRFTAMAAGRFPIEIHSSELSKQRTVAYLEVRPR